MCEINNNHSLVKEIIEHILKGRYQQKQSRGDGRYQYNENKLAPQSDWDKRGGFKLYSYQALSFLHWIVDKIWYQTKANHLKVTN